MAMIKTSINEKELCREKACPTCGGIECFERPRYFSGQLLTDKDLDAAQRYVIEKNKLHNRYLVGTGVVCGLAVRCDPCDEGAVVVEPGYAIDCCGNDIVLCESKPFNVSEYIKKCLKKKKNECEDMIKTESPSECEDAPKEYCLVLSYNEEPARPVTALIRDNGCSASRCEPSRTKEIFRFDLIEKEKAESLMVSPNISKKIQECLKKASQYYTKCHKEFEKTEKKPDDLKKFFNSSLDISRIFRYDCICDAILVPCPECGEIEGVVLACLTIQNDKILKINNNMRTQVITGPALRYWEAPVKTLLGSVFTLINLCREVVPGKVSTPAPGTIPVWELINRPVSEVGPKLERINVTFSEKRVVMHEEAYVLPNYIEMIEFVQPESEVELTVSPDNLVTCICILKEDGK